VYYNFHNNLLSCCVVHLLYGLSAKQIWPTNIVYRRISFNCYPSIRRQQLSLPDSPPPPTTISDCIPLSSSQSDFSLCHTGSFPIFAHIYFFFSCHIGSSPVSSTVLKAELVLKLECFPHHIRF
jgi:hypothetical protein